MGFYVSFDQPVSPYAETSTSEVRELTDDYQTLVIEACSELSDAEGSRFRIGGFGSDEWPVDVAYDFSAFMEQLPSLLAGMRGHFEVEVDLYSQGTERTLVFRPVDNLVMIHCESRTDWVPTPAFETLAQDELVEMLRKLAKDFAKALKAINSELSELEPFARWLEGEV